MFGCSVSFYYVLHILHNVFRCFPVDEQLLENTSVCEECFETKMHIDLYRPTHNKIHFIPSLNRQQVLRPIA